MFNAFHRLTSIVLDLLDPDPELFLIATNTGESGLSINMATYDTYFFVRAFTTSCLEVSTSANDIARSRRLRSRNAFALLHLKGQGLDRRMRVLLQSQQNTWPIERVTCKYRRSYDGGGY